MDQSIRYEMYDKFINAIWYLAEKVNAQIINGLLLTAALHVNMSILMI